MGRGDNGGGDPHLDYGGVTEDDEYWLAEELQKLTGIKFIKLKTSKYDIDLESVGHVPKIYIEAEGTPAVKWPIDAISPPKWKKGISIPARKVKYFRNRVKNGEITIYVKFNHYRNQCFFVEGDMVVRRFDEGFVKNIYSPDSTHMSSLMVMLKENQVYYGFLNLATFINRKVENYKVPIKTWRIHTSINGFDFGRDIIG